MGNGEDGKDTKGTQGKPRLVIDEVRPGAIKTTLVDDVVSYFVCHIERCTLIVCFNFF